MRHAPDLGNRIDKSGFPFPETYLIIQLNASRCNSLALQGLGIYLGFHILFHFLFLCICLTVDDQDIRTFQVFPALKYQEHQTDKDASEHGKRDKSGCKDNTRCNTPEKERNIHRLFDRCTESDNR